MDPSAPRSIYEELLALERHGTACVLIALVEVRGSTPQDSGAKMLVTSSGLHAGTVAGGKVEARAIDVARELLSSHAAQSRFVDWSLRRDVGITCGGSVKLYFEPHPACGAGVDWPIWIFCAGHVAQAVVPVLLTLAFVGVIGSKAKAAVLRKEMIADGLPAERAQEFHCPVGLPFGTNHPQEIALSVAAQLLAERDALKTRG